MPRVHDRRSPQEREKCVSKLLPPYLRKTKDIKELIPWLYLKGISTGDMGEALQTVVATDAGGLSPATVSRLKKVWEQEFKTWNSRALEGKIHVNRWADGVHFNLRLQEDGLCVLMLIGPTADGTKELIAVSDGNRSHSSLTPRPSTMGWGLVLVTSTSTGRHRRG